MFSILKKKKPEEIVLPNTLSKKEQKQIKKLIKKAKKDDGIPRTAQQSIPYQRMFPDGICRVRDSYYTKTVQFQDINYQLAQKEDKTAIFEEWCSFLNFFDSSVHFEISFMNMSTDAEDFEKNVRIPLQKDEFNLVRNEYSQMLKSQLAQGNNGLTKTKYLTFGIEAESMRQAKPRLEHIQTDLLNNFRRLGVAAKLLNGKERLQLMHSIFHMGDLEKFQFDWNWLAPSGLSTKDFIAPTSFSFHGNRIFQNVSSQAFERFDFDVWRCLWRWCKRRHPKKGHKWIAKKYFRRVGTRYWTFSVNMADSFELHLIYATDTKIVRWLKTKSEATPFDERFTEYFEDRDTKRMFREINGRRKLNALYKMQKGICPHCGEPITVERGFRIHTEMGADFKEKKVLLHADCHRELHYSKNVDELVLLTQGL